jgi:hypothetical protein
MSNDVVAIAAAIAIAACFPVGIVVMIAHDDKEPVSFFHAFTCPPLAASLSGQSQGGF